MPKESQSLFTNFMAPPERNDIIRMRRMERLQNNLKLFGQGSTLAESQAAQTGAILGSIFGDKFIDPARLTSDEERDQRVAETAKRLQSARMWDPAYAKLDAEDQQLANAEDLAQAYADEGDTARAAELAIQVSKRREEKKKAKLEYDKLEQDVGAVKENREINLSKERREKIGEYGAFVVPGQGGWDFMTENPDVVTGKISEDGELITDDGRNLGSYLSLDNFTKLQKSFTDAKKAGGKGGQSDAIKQFFAAIGGSERKEQRDAMRAISQQMQIMDDIATDVEGLIKKGIDPATMLDGSGRIIDFATNLESSIKAIGGAVFSVPIMLGKEVLSTGEKADVMAKYDSFIKEAVVLPPGMDAAGPEAAKYRGAIAELAYATARANEPGARQLSDHDYKMALTQIGAAAADPEKMRQVVMANLTRKLKTYGNDVQLFGDIAVRSGLERSQGLGLIYGDKAMEDFTARTKAIGERFDKLGGTLAEGQAKRDAATRAQFPGAPMSDGSAPEAIQEFDFTDVSDEDLARIAE